MNIRSASQLQVDDWQALTLTQVDERPWAEGGVDDAYVTQSVDEVRRGPPA